MVIRPTDADFAALVVESHQRFTGEPLNRTPDGPPGPSRQALADWLYADAPFGLLAHDTADDPRFVYANVTAQRCFAYSWDEMVGLPSRLSAEPQAQEDREALLRAVAADHYATGYRGRRIGKAGRRFWIEDVTMWDLVDGEGVHHGQAAVFRHWSEV